METRLLKSIPLFESLTADETALVASRMQISRFARNTLLIHEGEESSSLFIILTGKVKIFLLDETGQEVILNYLHEGDYFGEISLFNNDERSASVQTMEDSYFGVLEKEDFLELLTTHPELSMTILRGATQRMRDLSNNVRSLAANW